MPSSRSPRRLAASPLHVWIAACALAGAGALGGCSADPRDFGTGGEGGAGGGQGGAGAQGGGGDGAGAQGGGGGTAGGDPCAPGAPPFQGPLCGPPEVPCGVLADELVPSDPSFRNDAPALDVDADCAPHVVFSVAEGGFNGFYGLRDGPGAWSVESTPFAVATAGLTHASDGAPVALAYDGAYNASLWTRAAGQWLQLDQVPGQVTVWANGFARGSGDILLAAFNTSNYVLQLGTHTDIWTVAALSMNSSTPVSLGVSPDGIAHVLGWGSDQNGWQLSWYSPPQASELAMSLGSGLLDWGSQMQRVAVTAPDDQNPTGRPHVMAVKPQPNSQWMSLLYLTRNGPGTWAQAPIDQEDPNGATCNFPPQGPGDTCQFDFEKIFPTGIVAGPDGGVRFLYAKHRSQGTLVAQCDQMFCDWVPQEENVSGTLFIGWIGPNGQPVTAVVAEPLMPGGSTVKVDRGGRIHVATYDSYPVSQGGTTVHYLQIGQVP